MTNYTPNDAFPAVQQYEVSDPVLGGNSGESNAPIHQLADRTQYLYNRLGRWPSIISVTAGGTISSSIRGGLVRAQTGSNGVVVIDDTSAWPEGSSFRMIGQGPVGKALTIQSAGGRSFYNGSTPLTHEFICDQESMTFVYNSGAWIIDYGVGNWERAGTEALLRFIPRNAILADGRELLRADYPRLFQRASYYMITDLAWLFGIHNQGFYSNGNLTTTFRIPDLRSMYLRGLDLGRGVSATLNIEGRYQADGVGAHTHGLPPIPLRLDDGDRGTDGLSKFSVDDLSPATSTGSTGAAETTTKNIGLFPVIYY